MQRIHSVLLLILGLIQAYSLSIIILHKGKGIPITGHEGPRGMWMQGSTYSQPRHLDEVGWLVLRSAAFTPREIPRYSFYRRLSGPPGPVWTRRCEEKSPPLRHPGSNPGRPARSQVPCRLSHLAHNNFTYG